jgi:hypothetical protein
MHHFNSPDCPFTIFDSADLIETRIDLRFANSRSFKRGR